MKKFEKIKILEISKLTREQMYQVKGGMQTIELVITGATHNVCHTDGYDDQ